MAGRLPEPLRPARRLFRLWSRSAWLMVFPVGVLIASVALADRSAAVQATPTPAPIAGSGGAGATHWPGAYPELSLPPRPPDADVLGLGIRRVVLDPGHGGVDVGASSAGGALEKTLALDLARRVESLLVAQGVEVTLTRSGDRTISLKDRAAAAKAAGGDIFVSIHLNVLEPSSARGVETYYLGPSDSPEHDVIVAAENQHSGYSLGDMRTLLDTIYEDARRDESRRLAQSVHRSLVGRLQAANPGLRDRGVKTAPFIVLVATEMPAILAEVSCVSNAEEAERLSTVAYRTTIAEALASGIRAFIDQKSTDHAERKNARES